MTLINFLDRPDSRTGRSNNSHTETTYFFSKKLILMSEKTGVPQTEKRQVRAVLRSIEAQVRSQRWKARLMTTNVSCLPALLQIRLKK